MTDDDVLAYVQEGLPGFEPDGEPTRLPEGNLNIVWRVPGTPESIIVKFAPPYIAANPDVPLDPSRLVFEARSLEALAPDGPLTAVCSEHVRPPRPLSMRTDPHVLLMEDVGPHPTLGRWLRDAGTPRPERASAGRWVGSSDGCMPPRMRTNVSPIDSTISPCSRRASPCSTRPSTRC